MFLRSFVSFLLVLATANAWSSTISSSFGGNVLANTGGVCNGARMEMKKGKANVPPQMRGQYKRQQQQQEQRKQMVDAQTLGADGFPIFNLFVRTKKQNVSLHLVWSIDCCMNDQFGKYNQGEGKMRSDEIGISICIWRGNKQTMLRLFPSETNITLLRHNIMKSHFRRGRLFLKFGMKTCQSKFFDATHSSFVYFHMTDLVPLRKFQGRRTIGSLGQELRRRWYAFGNFQKPIGWRNRRILGERFASVEGNRRSCLPSTSKIQKRLRIRIQVEL
jgi:hypothetical protein